MRGQQEFVYETIHKLRDPLTICSGHLQMLEEVGADQRDALMVVSNELDRMAKLLSDLEMLANLEDECFLSPEWIDLELLAHELTAMAGALAERDWRLEQTGQGRLFADRRLVGEAVTKLADNAIAHTAPDDTIVLEAGLSEAECRLALRDTGPGISAADQASIFEPFTRGADSHRRARGGGLGLAIVKAISEAHGGRVELESRVGAGSTFTIVLPRICERGRRD